MTGIVAATDGDVKVAPVAAPANVGSRANPIPVVVVSAATPMTSSPVVQVPDASLRRRAWDHSFFSGLINAAPGSEIRFELANGIFASGTIRYVERRNGELIYVTGFLTAPEAGRFFFQKQTVSGKQGDFSGVVEFSASKTAWRIEPIGPGKTAELVERKLDEVVCPALIKAAEEATNTVEVSQSLRPDQAPDFVPAYNSGIISLQSLPGATGVLYIDYRGGYTPTWGGITYAKPNVSNAGIKDVWKRVAEDYMPFNINVTTDIKVFEAAPEGRRQRCICTPTSDGGSGGVSYIGSWNWTGDTPNWAYMYTGKLGAEVITHECGHALGLSHDGRTAPYNEGYYGGHGSGVTGWAPIMGVSYYKPVSQWSRGEYAYANQVQDDLNIIVSNNNNVDYRADDTGGTLATARFMEIYTNSAAFAEGVIGTTGDCDAFRFTTTGGIVSLTASPVGDWANLAIMATLADATDTTIASNSPQDVLTASLSTNLAAGTYTFRVTGAGRNDPLTSGFSAYGSLGYYSITGSIASATLSTRFSLDENSSNGTLVGVVDATNLGIDALSYTFISGNTSNTFALDNNGTLTVTNAAMLDYEMLAKHTVFAPQFEMFVNITNTVHPELTELNRRVLVRINDINEAPTLTCFTNTLLAHTVIGTLVGTIQTSDPEEAISAVSIISGNSNSMFSLDNITGNVLVSGDLNADTQSVYNLVMQVTDNGTPSLSVTNIAQITVIPNDSPFRPGTISYAVYDAIGSGVYVSNLTGNTRFPVDPTWERQILAAEGDTSRADNYGSVLRGYLIPPVSGDYTFCLATDNNGELWMSTTTNPASMTRIADITGSASYAGVRQWDKFPSQKSVLRTLVAGQAYYLEARQKEGGGGDNLAVGWTGPATGGKTNVIPALYLAPYPMNYTPHLTGFTSTIRRDSVTGFRVGLLGVTDVNSDDTHSFAIIAGDDTGIFGVDSNGWIVVASDTALAASTPELFTLTAMATDNGTPILAATSTVSITVQVGLRFSRGSITWDNGLTSNQWSSTSGGPLDHDWLSGNDAVFETTAGTVSVGVGGSTAHDITFTVSGYTIANSTLTLNGSAPVISIGAGCNATISSVIAGTNGLTTVGEGTLTLSGANAYSGATTLGGGTIILSGGHNRLPAGSALNFIGTSTMNLAGVSQALGTVTVTNNVAATILGGSLTANGSLLQVGGSAAGSVAALDLSGLSAFSYANVAGSFVVSGSQGAGGAGSAGVLTLAQSNTITTLSLGIGTLGGNVSSADTGVISLGANTTINADTNTLGSYRGSGTMHYAGVTNAILTIRGTAGGSSRAGTVRVGDSSGPALAVFGMVDLTNNVTGTSTLDAMMGTMVVGRNSRASSAGNSPMQVSGYFSMGGGTLDATNIVIGQNLAGLTLPGTTSYTTGIVTVASGTVKVQTLYFADQQVSVTAPIRAVFNLNRGATLKAMTIAKGPGAGTAATTRTLNWNDGTITPYGPGTNLAINSLRLTLAATGNHTFDTDTNAITLAGTAVIDGSGGLTKMGAGVLTLSGTNTYSGATVISNGTVVVSASGTMAQSTDMTLLPNAQLTILNTGNALSDASTLYLSAGAKLYLTNGVNETIGALYIGGVPAATGTWGTVGCRWTNATVFAGAGVLNVTAVPSAYTISASADPIGGTIMPDGSVLIGTGSSQNYLITVTNAGYHISDVVVDGCSVGATNAYTFSNVIRNHTIAASFELNTYTLTVNTPYGTAVPAGVTTSQWNSVIAATVTTPVYAGATTQYVCRGWTGTGSVASGVGTSTTFSLISNSTIDWLWTTNYMLTAGSTNCTVNVANGFYGTNVTITATPASGYHFATWSGDTNGCAISSNQITVVMTQPREITAVAAINVYTITASAGAAGGTIAPGGAIQVETGNSTNFVIAVTNAGYHISDVVVDGSSVGATNAYTFTNVIRNHAIVASFSTNSVTAGLQYSRGSLTWDNDITANQWGGTSGGALNQVWLSGNDAVFETTAGAVSVGAGGVTAHNITFNVSGFSIASNTLTLSGSTPTMTIGSGSATISSIIAGANGLTKAGAGTLTLSGASTYGGGTTLGGGTLVLSGGSNRLPTTGTLGFSGASTVDLSGISQTLANVTVADAKTGTITGSGGTLALTGSPFSLGGLAINTTQTLTLSGLGVFTYANAAGTFQVSGRYVNSVNSGKNSFGVLTLAATNTITAATVNVGAPGSSGQGYLNYQKGTVNLGSANTINAGKVNIGAGAYGFGVVSFRSGLPGIPALKLRGLTGGGSRVDMTVGSNTGGQSSFTTVVDLAGSYTGGSVLDAMLGTMRIAYANRSSGVLAHNVSAVFTMGGGLLDATTIIIGSDLMYQAAPGTASGTFNLGSTNGVPGGTVKVATLTLGDMLGGGAINSTFNLNRGGTLAAQFIQAGAGGASRTFNWNDGMITTVGPGTNLAISALDLKLAATGSHVFDPGADAITVADTAGISGSGGLIKIGAGMLTFNGANSYTGSTAISNGTLLVNGAISNSAVSVSAGGALGGTGVIGGVVTVNNGGVLSPGLADGVGTLTINNALICASGSVVQVALGTSSDLIAVKGNATMGGTLNITNAGGFTTNSYMVLTYTGTLSTNGLVLGTVPDAADYVYAINTNTAGQVRLDVAFALTPFVQWRLQNFGSLTNVNAQADADPDGDRMTNYQEFLAGTDPKLAGSVLDIRGAAVAASNGFGVSWQSVSGKTYQVAHSFSLTDPWLTNLANSILASTGQATLIYVDTTANTATNRFYRINLVQ